MIGNVIITPDTLGLGRVNNTNDIEKPVSDATQQALNTKVDNTVFNTYKAAVTSDLATKIPLAQKASANGVATLDGSKLLPLDQLPVLPKAKVPLSVATEGFKDPVTVTLSGDVLGSFTIDGRTPKITVNSSFVTSPISFAGTYGSSTSIPVISVDTKGRLTAASQIAIPTSNLTRAGLVRLNDTLGATATDQAATIAAVSRVNALAVNTEATTVKSNTVGKSNGVASLDASGRLPREQLPISGAIIAESLSRTSTFSITGDATWSASFNGTADATGAITLSTVLEDNADVLVGDEASTITIKANGKGLVTEVSQIPIKIPFSAISPTPTTLAGYGITDAYTKKEIEDLITASLSTAVPAGTIAYFSTRYPPNGWLACNGQYVSTTTYSRLYSAIGSTYGLSGNTFRVPDLRGEFIRCWDNSRGVDSGRSFASYQSSMLGSHTHTVSLTGFCNGKDSGRHNDARWSSGDVYYNRTLTNADAIIGTTGGTETRPRNFALIAMIKT